MHQAIENPRTCGDCTRTSDNKQFDCPPRMSDGRLFTDYRSRCDINFIHERLSSMDSYSYRQFLLQNADALLGTFRTRAYDTARCGPCQAPYNIGTMEPEMAIDVCNDRTCQRAQVGDGSGIGLGRWYSDSSAHNKSFEEFKAREQAGMSVAANCCGARSDYEAYFPPTGAVRAEDLNRYAMSGGGLPLSGGDHISMM